MEKRFNEMWACGRPMGSYRGLFPNGFLERLQKLIPFDNKKILNLFNGTIKQQGLFYKIDGMDINPINNPIYLCDCREKFPIKDETYDMVIADPPYDSEEIHLVYKKRQKINIVKKVHYGDKLYNTDFVRPYSFVDEAIRVLKPKGYFCVLHHLIYKTPPHTVRIGVIGITTGPNMRIRALNIFQKQ